ncbi:MAG: tyrosine-type recombinase/integrase [Saprospiraceae bacterium]|nr:tyrosine-type recombinase/integrase [Saprospiraceae bacterium]
MDKYQGKGIPRLSNQKLNKYVKEIVRTAGIVQQVTITEHRGGKMHVRKYAKWELVSSHTARRSFATNAVLSGIPALEVMKFTGHRSMASFLQYVRITGQETAINYASHPFFNQ